MLVAFYAQLNSPKIAFQKARGLFTEALILFFVLIAGFAPLMAFGLDEAADGLLMRFKHADYYSKETGSLRNLYKKTGSYLKNHGEALKNIHPEKFQALARHHKMLQKLIPVKERFATCLDDHETAMGRAVINGFLSLEQIPCQSEASAFNDVLPLIESSQDIQHADLEGSGFYPKVQHFVSENAFYRAYVMRWKLKRKYKNAGSEDLESVDEICKEFSCTKNLKRRLQLARQNTLNNFEDGGVNESRSDLNSRVEELNKKVGVIKSQIHRHCRHVTRGLNASVECPEAPEVFQNHESYLKAYQAMLGSEHGLLLQTEELSDKIGKPQELYDIWKGQHPFPKRAYKTIPKLSHSDVKKGVDDALYWNDKAIEEIQEARQNQFNGRGSRKEDLMRLLSQSPSAFADHLSQMPEDTLMVCSLINEAVADQRWDEKKTQLVTWGGAALTAAGLATFGAGSIAGFSLSAFGATAAAAGTGLGLAGAGLGMEDAYNAYQEKEKACQGTFAGGGEAACRDAVDEFWSATQGAAVAGVFSVAEIGSILRVARAGRSLSAGARAGAKASVGAKDAMEGMGDLVRGYASLSKTRLKSLKTKYPGLLERLTVAGKDLPERTRRSLLRMLDDPSKDKAISSLHQKLQQSLGDCL